MAENLAYDESQHSTSFSNDVSSDTIAEVQETDIDHHDADTRNSNPTTISITSESIPKPYAGKMRYLICRCNATASSI